MLSLDAEGRVLALPQLDVSDFVDTWEDLPSLRSGMGGEVRAWWKDQ